MSWVGDMLKAAASSAEPRAVAKKVPSDRQLQVRQANAVRVADKISGLIATGHQVFDEAGDQILEVIVGKGGDVLFRFRDGGNTVMFMNAKDYDNGAMDSVKAFNASFAGWTFLHPKDIRPLKI
jgi:hypothetical protein